MYSCDQYALTTVLLFFSVKDGPSSKRNPPSILRLIMDGWCCGSVNS